MKIKINMTIDVDTKSFAACYGEDHIKEIHEKTSAEDAQLCCEQALNDWFNSIGFEGKILKAQAQPVTFAARMAQRRESFEHFVRDKEGWPYEG